MSGPSITVTPNEWAARRDGSLWLVRAGESTPMWGHDAVGHGADPGRPPTEFVEATKPCPRVECERRRYTPKVDADGRLVLCPDCRIELRQVCPVCGDSDDPGEMVWPDTGCLTTCAICEGDSSVLLGSAYPASGVLLVVDPFHPPSTPVSGKRWDEPAFIVVSDVVAYVIDGDGGCRRQSIWPALAHYGDPAALVGQYTIELRVVEA